MALETVPLTLRQANAFILAFHRHHKPVVGHRFSIGARSDGKLVGVAIVGRPVAAKTDAYGVAEVTRLATDGTRNACSVLYAACARAAKAMGFSRIQTFTLETETGSSLRASGWRFDAVSNGRLGWQNRGNRRQDQPTCAKHRWVLEFKATPPQETGQ